jgi:hypothetical protein
MMAGFGEAPLPERREHTRPREQTWIKGILFRGSLLTEEAVGMVDEAVSWGAEFVAFGRSGGGGASHPYH